MNFADIIKCDRLTLGKNWNRIQNESDHYSAIPDKINGAIVKLENYNGTMVVLSFRSDSVIHVQQNALHYNHTDIIECQ